MPQGDNKVYYVKYTNAAKSIVCKETAQPHDCHNYLHKLIPQMSIFNDVSYSVFKEKEYYYCSADDCQFKFSNQVLQCGYLETPLDPYYLALSKCNSVTSSFVSPSFKFTILNQTITNTHTNYTCLDNHCPVEKPLLKEDSICHDYSACLHDEYTRLAVSYTDGSGHA